MKKTNTHPSLDSKIKRNTAELVLSSLVTAASCVALSLAIKNEIYWVEAVGGASLLLGSVATIRSAIDLKNNVNKRNYIEHLTGENTVESAVKNIKEENSPEI